MTTKIIFNCGEPRVIVLKDGESLMSRDEPRVISQNREFGAIHDDPRGRRAIIDSGMDRFNIPEEWETYKLENFTLLRLPKVESITYTSAKEIK